MLQQYDPRNQDLIVNINGELVHRDQAGISPFDSAVQGGDAVWEGLRLYDGRIFKLDEHLARLEARRSPSPSPRSRAAERSGARCAARSGPTTCATACTSG